MFFRHSHQVRCFHVQRFRESKDDVSRGGFLVPLDFSNIVRMAATAKSEFLLRKPKKRERVPEGSKVFRARLEINRSGCRRNLHNANRLL